MRQFQIFPRPRWRGFSFALHLTRCRAFLFARRRISHTQAFTAAFLPSMQLYIPNGKTVYRALQGISVDFPHSSTHNTAATQTAYAPPATHWRAYRQALHLHRYQIPPPRRTLYKSAQPPIIIAQPPIIIRYIRGAQTMPARRGSPTAGGAEPLTALAVSLFGLSPDS